MSPQGTGRYNYFLHIIKGTSGPEKNASAAIVNNQKLYLAMFAKSGRSFSLILNYLWDRVIIGAPRHHRPGMQMCLAFIASPKMRGCIGRSLSSPSHVMTGINNGWLLFLPPTPRERYGGEFCITASLVNISDECSEHIIFLNGEIRR